jgi:ABC-type nitrate/sulfonate/bicarbonate transport system permease component
MNPLFIILFGLPLFIIIAILVYIGIVGTGINIYHAIKNKDYEFLALAFMLTTCAASAGWIIGSLM